MMTQGRINTHSLQAERINEIPFIMNRLTPLTQSSLEMISFKHNGIQNSKIYFYGIYITEYENRVRHYFPVNVYIRSFWLKVALCPSAEPIGNLDSFSFVIVFNLFNPFHFELLSLVLTIDEQTYNCAISRRKAKSRRPDHFRP
jgi:hypothetical protein